MQLRVASYNIHGGVGRDRQRDYQRIGRHLASMRVDIALLQEVDARHLNHSLESNPASLIQRPNQQLVPAPAVTRDAGWYGNALLSCYPVIESYSIDVSQQGLEPRNIQIAKVDVAGKHLRVINTHKGLKTGERRTQFARLHEQLSALREAPEPIVLGGDFNEWQFFSRVFKAINEVLTPVRTGATFPASWPLFRLDRLWISPGNRLLHCQVVRNAATRLHSDHCPIVVDLEFG